MRCSRKSRRNGLCHRVNFPSTCCLHLEAACLPALNTDSAAAPHVAHCCCSRRRSIDAGTTAASRQALNRQRLRLQHHLHGHHTEHLNLLHRQHQPLLRPRHQNLLSGRRLHQHRQPCRPLHPSKPLHLRKLRSRDGASPSLCRLRRSRSRRQQRRQQQRWRLCLHLGRRSGTQSGGGGMR